MPEENFMKLGVYIVARQRVGKNLTAATKVKVFLIPFYLQSVPVHSANCV
jgi:hypothetical protein